MKNEELIVFTLISIIPSYSYSAANKPTPIPDTKPLGARIITSSEYQAFSRAGRLAPIPRNRVALATDSNWVSAKSRLEGFTSDFEMRFPTKRDLLKTDLEAHPKIVVSNSSGQSQTIILLGSDFAAATIAETLQARDSQFNERLLSQQLSELTNRTAKSELASAEAIVGPSCNLETGYSRGLDGSKTAISYSAAGIHENFSWPLKPYASCVKDQANRGSCTAFATDGAIETMVAAQTRKWINLSEQALYNQSKLFWSSDYVPSAPSFSHAQLEGFSTATLLSSAKRYSYRFPLETEWEYNASYALKVVSDPSSPQNHYTTHACDGYSGICSNTVHQGEYVCAKAGTVYDCGYLTPIQTTGKGVRVRDYAELWNFSDPAGSLALMSNFLQSGRPLIVSFGVTPRFYAVKDGYSDVSDLIKDWRSADYILGYHAVAMVGYINRNELLQKLPHAPVNSTRASLDSPQAGYFIIKNSWSSKWGDGGYVYVPGDYLAKYLIGVQSLSGIDLVGL